MKHIPDDAIQESFHTPYLDPAAQVVRTLSYIDNYACKWSNSKEKSLGPFTSLVQSSMFGKSRLLREMSHHVPVIYMSLRAERTTDEADLSNGFPRGHTELGNWFDTVQSIPNITNLLRNAIVLFSRNLQEWSLSDGFVDMFDYLHLLQESKHMRNVLACKCIVFRR